ncbi:transcriptional regulator, AraC family [Mucilaginibacter frigoritolerans]|uniref:Transcriptional regulator, AraC family n=1 Tax=Mucilaginibacter frigoritolerans TaxID=652788 RepID=A0A562TLU5_9SPHI|nr:helix-turn-helix transcriptional regulator [Mucilaginibacter frigoritolerans]TWI94541.1 transcriptional regulator, AraC family [Mucilaginibacter frigoritolerans]
MTNHVFKTPVEKNVQKFLLGNFIHENDAFHIARVTIHTREDLSLHSHDYAEIFWVEKGKGYHLINDQKVLLQPGHLVMIRPDDKHTFTSDKHGITIMNLAFSLETLAHLRARYFPDSKLYFWTNDKLPFQKLLDLTTINQISKRAEGYWKCQKSNLYVDSLLLSIFRFISLYDNVKVDNQQIPSWLNKALQEFTSPELFKAGQNGFANLCEKNIDHVNRTVKRVFNKTLTELITELRMNYAAQQLSITNVPIKLICIDCGLTNLAHFYKIFKETYHQPPSVYRKATQTIV